MGGSLARRFGGEEREPGDSGDVDQIRGQVLDPNSGREQLENHAAAFALYMMFYNFGRVHQTLRITPAMAAGISENLEH